MTDAPSRPPCARSRRRSPWRWTARRSARRSTVGAARRGSARSSSIRATSSRSSVRTRVELPEPVDRTRARLRARGGRRHARERPRRGRRPSRLLHLVESAVTGAVDAPQAIECALVHKDGGTRQFEILMTNLLDEEHVGGIVLNARDVSERKAFEAQLTHQAFHDAVTGLANRALFAERVRHAIIRSRREDRGCAFCSSTSTTSRRSTTGSAMRRATRCSSRSRARLDASIRGARHRRPLRRRRVRGAARGHRSTPGGRRHRRAVLEAWPAAARGPQGARAPLQPRHLGAGLGGRRATPTR